MGTALSHLAADVAEAARCYGEEPMRCWSPRGDALKAIRFDAGLRRVGFMAAAGVAGEVAGSAGLAVTADAMLRLGET